MSPRCSRATNVVIALSLFVFFGCTQADSAASPPSSSSEPAPPAASSTTAPATRTIEVDTGKGPHRIVVKEVDGKLLYEGDIEIPPSSSSTTRSAAVFGGRWSQRTIPYEIASDFPHASRVTDAIAHWQQFTAMRFVPHTTEADYVRFGAGRGCSASVGRIGGMQNVTLEAGENIQSIAGADFDPAGGAHFWFTDGITTAGRSWDVDATTIAAEYTLPSGKAPTDIRDVAIAANGDVYTWFNDGTVSVGTSANLGAKTAPQAFALPANETPSRIVGAAFVSSGHVRAWYADGTTSEGTAYDLGAYAAPSAFTVATGQATSDLLAVGVSGDVAYTWYRNASASGGTVTSLAATYAPYTVTTPGNCGVPEIIHEIGHAVGFQHEQTRTDRDSYIAIQWANIVEQDSYNFDMHDASSEDIGAYDYLSIMHYESYAFSKNGQPTIQKLDGGLIGYASVLSAGDIAATTIMYP